ncbi:MAG: CRISPR-associated endonuclease Cas2 [Patescibacteria group bacterium]|nr:CRISPR-associated endonuclease Cas2 [Patescibacteria group bacterium]
MRKKSLKSNSRQAKLLLELDEALDFWFTMATQQTAVLKYGMDGVRYYRSVRERAYQRQAMRRLEEAKILAIKRVGDQYAAELTCDGVEELFRLKAQIAQKLPEGEICMVVFDIPESNRKLRSLLRRFLKKAGFTMLQQSVWIIKKDLYEDLAMLFTINGAIQWVKVFKSTEVN